ncbi:MAG: MFS transporter [Deltaproteobacteria bacterium]|nr:MAG: MFS transporter [Deltaproteobacteria bacterium]
MRRDRKSNIPIKLQLLLSAILVLLLAQGFSVALTVSSFGKFYTNSLVSSYTVVGRDFQRNVESALRFGKPIEKLYGIERFMEAVKKNSQDLDNLTISLPEGKVLYSTKRDQVGSTLRLSVLSDKIINDALRTRFNSGEKAAQLYSVLHEGEYHILLSVRNRDGQWTGTIDLSFGEDIINSRVNKMISWNFKWQGIFTVITSVLIAFLLYLCVPMSTDERRLKMRIYLILFSVLGISQITYSIFNAKHFQENYMTIVRTKTLTLTSLLKDDIDYLLNKGVRIDRLIKIDLLLSEIISATPEVDEIGILDRDKRWLYLADVKGVVELHEDETQAEALSTTDYEYDLEDWRYSIIVPVSGKSDIEGYIRVNLSREFIGSQVREMVYDTLTVAIISLLFMVELVIFLLIFMKRQLSTMAEEPASQLQQGRDRFFEKNKGQYGRETYGLIRPGAFMYLFATALSVSFLPLHMANLYEPMLGLSREIILGLPISAEMLLAGIGIIIAGNMTDKRGWQNPFFYGIAATAVGAFLSGTAEGSLSFILYRSILGLGYGLTWMSFQGFILATTDTSTKARGIANMAAGIFSGSICGGAAGGMLAERIGFAPVFFMAAALAFLPLLFTLFFLRETYQKPREISLVSQEGIGLRNIASYIFDRDIIGLILFATIPGALCFVGFLYYATPIYLKAQGLTQSNIARLIMIYGISMIYLAPLVNKYVDRSGNKKGFIAAGGIIGGLGLAVFFFYKGTAAAVFAIMMLGISSSAGLVAQTVYAVDAPAASRIGAGKAMGIYRFLQRMGQVLGPIVLGIMLTYTGIEKGFAITGAAYIVLTIVFIAVVKNPSQMVQHE